MANSEESDQKQPEKAEMKHDEKRADKKAVNNSTRNILFGIVGILVLVAVFLGGIQAADNRRGPVTAHGFGMPFEQKLRTGGSRYGGDFQQSTNSITLSAKVSSVNGNDFTVDQNGSSKTIKTNSNTHFRGVGISGLKSGDQVVVSGTTNSDGSIQALGISVGAVTTSDTAPAPEAGTTQSF